MARGAEYRDRPRRLGADDRHVRMRMMVPPTAEVATTRVGRNRILSDRQTEAGRSPATGGEARR